MNTKEKILEEALRLFSIRGYTATGVEQIAAAVGIKAASLYKHYRNKIAIFDAIFEETGRRYKELTDSISVIHDDKNKTEIGNLKSITADELVDKVQKLVEYSLDDEYIANFRKMMTVEQYNSQEFSELYQQRYLEMMFKYHEELFIRLIELNLIKNEDPRVLAELYGSSIYVHISNCDRKTETKQECLSALEKHVRLFYKTFSKEE